MGNRKSKDNAKDGALILAAKAAELAAGESGVIDETALFERVAAIIERRKNNAAAYASSEGTLMFWEVGQYINSVILDEVYSTLDKEESDKLNARLAAPMDVDEYIAAQPEHIRQDLRTVRLTMRMATQIHGAVEKISCYATIGEI